MCMHMSIFILNGKHVAIDESSLLIESLFLYYLTRSFPLNINECLKAMITYYTWTNTIEKDHWRFKRPPERGVDPSLGVWVYYFAFVVISLGNEGEHMLIF